MKPEIAQVPVSGRRRHSPLPKAPGHVRGGAFSLLRLGAVAVALAGVALVAFGAVKATVLAPSATTRAVLTPAGGPVVSAAVGLLGLEGPRVQVQATSAASRPVFVGIGRAHDVDAYLAAVSRTEIIGDDGDGKLLTRRLGNQATLPDPAAVDVWVVSARGQGSASLVWPDAPGQWRLVVASDGAAAAADSLTLTWSGRQRHTIGPELIAIGLVLLVAGIVTLVVLVSRARLGDE